MYDMTGNFFTLQAFKSGQNVSNIEDSYEEFDSAIIVALECNDTIHPRTRCAKIAKNC